MSSTPATQPAFLADAMLHGLARWLRALGFDTIRPDRDDPELVALAETQGRILLTRDRALINDHQPKRVLLIRQDKPLQQLREVIAACDISEPAGLFHRCLLCNTPVRPATDGEIASLIPEPAREKPGPFSRCPECGRLYWPGSHTRRMRRALEAAVPELFPKRH